MPLLTFSFLSLLSVIVPQGMSPGQTLLVAAPDGSRTVSATIPQGLSPGQTFMVTFPSAPGVPSSAGDNNSVKSSKTPTIEAEPIATPIMSPMATPINPPVAPSPVPFSQALDNPPPSIPPPPSQNTNTNAPSRNSNNQKLLLVQVPPGTAVGATLYVQVPGENRTLAAKVPAGVTQFHVSYEPRTSSITSNNTCSSNSNTIAQQPMPVPTNDNGQKLILVRVPPGTAPGTTLHVEVPDEPGRILAAQVPPNVSEFQVAYQPRNDTRQTSARPQTAYDVPPNQQRNNNNGMMSNAMLPMVGGAAMGMAGMAMYDHYHHPYGYGGGYDTGYADTGGYDDYGGGDYGGGDFGGDFDGGF